MNSVRASIHFKGIFLLSLITFYFVSCSKDTPFGIIQNEIAPPPITAGKDKFASSLQDTVTLTTVSSSAEILNPANYKFSWTNIQKPTGAKDPVIANPGSYETVIYGMVPGEYQFQVEASNKKGLKKDIISVTIVPDTLSGKTIYIDGLTWNIINIPLFPGSTASKNIIAELQTNFERPDLFFRKQWSMEVSYLTEGEQSWKSTEDFKFEINDYKSISLSRENLTQEWRLLNLKKVTMRIRFL
jgi:hypothetical protein